MARIGSSREHIAALARNADGRPAGRTCSIRPNDSILAVGRPMKLILLYKELISTIRAELERRSWQADACDPIFRRIMHEDPTAFLGLNRAHRGNAIEINPVVGFRYEPLEARFAEFEDIGYTTSRPPTVSRSLGYLMPGNTYRPWLFERLEDLDTIPQLIVTMEAYGMPFAKCGSRLSGTLELLEDPHYGIRNRRLLRLVTTYVMQGQNDEARALGGC